MPVTVPTWEEFLSLEARVAALEAGNMPNPPDPGPADRLEITGPDAGEEISGVVPVTGLAGANWINITSWVGNTKASEDAAPIDGTFVLEVDTAKFPNGETELIVRAYSVPPGQPGGDTKEVTRMYLIANATTAAGNAVRLADVLQCYGANTYANGQDGSGGDGTNTVAAHVQGLNLICGGSGIGMTLREYMGDLNIQRAFCRGIAEGVPGVKWIITHNYSGQVPDQITLVKYLNDLGFCAGAEGWNEPNMDLGRPPVEPAVAAQDQKQLYDGLRGTGIPVYTPALGENNEVSGPGFAERWWGTSLQMVIDNSDRWCSHDYPNSGCPSRDMGYRTSGVAQTFKKTLGGVSEWAADLYNNYKDQDRVAYHSLIALLNGYKNFGVGWLAQWSFYDYNGFSPTGLFMGHDPTKPYPVALALRALFQKTGDTGANKHTFTPGSLDISFSGLPGGPTAQAGGQYLVMQSSDGRFHVAVWNEQDSISGARSPVQVGLGRRAAKVTDYSLTMPTAMNVVPVQTLTNTSGFIMQLGTEVRLLVVEP